MKKFKTLFSLLLVMTFMLSLAGPMAFAAGTGDGSTAENAIPVTVVVNGPRFNDAENKYVYDGYTVKKSNGDSVDANLIDAQLQATVTGNNISDTQASVVMSTKSGSAVVQGTDELYYEVTFDHLAATLSKPAITLTASEVFFDPENKQYVGKSATIIGDHGSDVLYYDFSTSSSTSSITVTPVSVVIKSGDVDVTNKYNIVCVPMDMAIPAYTITLAKPEFNAGTGEYQISGAAEYTTATININAHSSAYKVKPQFDLNDVVISNGTDSATASLDKSNVTLVANGADVTEAYNIEVIGSTYTKREIIITPKAPVSGEAAGFTATNPDGSAVTDYTVKATVYMDNGVAKIDSTSVKVILPENNIDYAKNMKITLKSTSVGNTGDNGTTGGNDSDNNGNNNNNNNNNNNGGNNDNNTTTTPNTSLVVYTGSKTWVYDGTAHSYTDGHSYTGLPTNWKVSVTYDNDSKITNVGTVPNVASVVVTNENGQTVNASDYKVVYGDLTVTKRALTIQATSAGKTPNGYAFSETDAKGVKFVNDTSLVSGHSLASGGLKVQYQLGTTTYTDYKDVTKAGTYIKRLILVDNVAVVVDAAGNDMTNNYAISTIDGTLTINSGWVSPDTGDHSNIALWITLLAVSAVAVAAVVVVVLKKNKKA